MFRLQYSVIAAAAVIGVIFLGIEPLEVQAAEHPTAVITEPRPRAIVKNRRNFPAAGLIQDYDLAMKRRLHYWVSIATVSDGKPDLHWPKFYVKEPQFKGTIFDGGQNPLPAPQPMLVLLLLVDDATNQRFTRWLRAGAPYEGFPVRQDEIVASVPIFFP